MLMLMLKLRKEGCASAGAGAVEGGGGEKAASSSPPLRKTKQIIVNTPPHTSASELATSLAQEPPTPVAGLRIRGAREIVGPYIQAVKGTRGSVARFRVVEGMWEVRRGVKIDGGERRKAMVRRKRTLEERKKRRD